MIHQECERALKRQRTTGGVVENDTSSYKYPLVDTSFAQSSAGATTALALILSSSTSSSSSLLSPATLARQTRPSRLASALTSLAEVLATLNLSQFQGKFEYEGYETEADLTELNPVQAEHVCDAIGMRSGHKIRFCRWVRGQRLEISSVDALAAVATDPAEHTQIVAAASASMSTVLLAELHKWKATAEKDTEQRVGAAVQAAEQRAAAFTAAATAALTAAQQRVATLEASMECSITHELMADPVMCADGQTYERSAIEQWFDTGSATSPATGEVLASLNLVPYIALRSAIYEIFPEVYERSQALDLAYLPHLLSSRSSFLST